MKDHTLRRLDVRGGMRICYITIRFPHPGETFAGSDVRALLRQGLDVEVHSLRPKHADTAELVAKWGVEDAELTHPSWSDVFVGVIAALRLPGLLFDALRLTLRTSSKPGQFLRTLLLLPRWLTIFRRIEEQRPEVVHLFWGHYPSFVARLVQKRLPHVVTSVFLGAYDIEWAYPLSRAAALDADVVWTHSRTNIGDLLAMGIAEERLELAYRGLDLASLPSERKKVAGRIVTAGRLLRFKGMDSVLHSFRLIRESCPDATLILLGDGPDRARLEELAKEIGIASDVEFRGHVHHQEVLSELASAQVMLFLSRKTSERLPNVVKEAMACGCYCVSTATRGIRELIPDEDHGAVVSIDNPQEAASVVVRALGDEDLRERVAANARVHIERNFDNRVTMGRYTEVWRKLASAKRMGRVPTMSLGNERISGT